MTDTLADLTTMRADIKLVQDAAPAIFTWSYERERDKLVKLYDKANQSQWVGLTDLDWATEVDPEQLVRTNEAPVVTLVCAAAKVPGSPISSWGEPEFTQIGIEFLRANLSQFMHGEQGAMLTAAKIVETVPWIDAKYYASTQVMDEARHTEVFAKYLHEKLGEPYPMGEALESQITALLEDGRWDIAYLGMQIIIESLALAAFGDLLARTDEPLLHKLLRYVLADEARHVAFGIMSLGEVYQHLSAAELKERQEFMLENTIRSRARAANPEVWERMGTSYAAVQPAIREAKASTGMSITGSFQRAFFSKLVPNTRKLGLLDANDGYLRQRWGEAGLLEFEHADDTADDYETYDAVAADRGEDGA
ncbi:MAG: ferritin-like domain-containing protein [Desertimonas sp.]